MTNALHAYVDCDWFHICKDLRKVNKYDMIYKYFIPNRGMSLLLSEKCYFNAYELSEIWQQYPTFQSEWAETYTSTHYISAYSMHSAYNQENI